jgi:hypothetical protein
MNKDSRQTVSIRIPRSALRITPVCHVEFSKMDISVYAENSRESNISAQYQGEIALPLARAFAVRMSLFHTLILETPDFRERYRNGNLVEIVWKNSDEIKFLAEHSGFDASDIRQSERTLDEAYKKARRKLHPDKPTGSHELFLKLENIYHALKNGG